MTIPAVAQQTPAASPPASPPSQTVPGPRASLGPASPSPKASPTASPTPGPAYGKMVWRSIGPATAGGRVPAVAGTDKDPREYFIGTGGGGVWRTANAGQTWSPVFDDQGVAAIGAVTIDPKDPSVVWVGTGEDNPRNDVSYGDGLYKTQDYGKHWKRVGLEATRQISRILIDPRNSKHVIVAAQGDLFNSSEDRGVYVTDDGGATWKKSLYAGPTTGASDLAMDRQNPDVIYAGMWQFQRRPWTFNSGGPDDGLYKSIDGGHTWTRLTGHGLPTDTTGRIGLAVAPSNGNRVYALIESKQGILWRSDDAGATWTMESNDTLVDQRPFYFTHIEVDPKNLDKVYAVSEMLSQSSDGGKHFHEIAGSVHVDYHAIWIAPSDPERIMVGEDGGFALTNDGGQTWFFSANLPIAQVYRVGLSNENPYWVCAGLQDNNAWCAPQNTRDPSGIQNKAWIAAAGGDGEWAVPDPIDPNFIWADSENGFATVENKVTKDSWYVQPALQLAAEQYDNRVAKVRWNWETPIAFAPWDGHIGWMGGNVLFQTTDRGKHWKAISGDLTRNIKEHQAPSGGPITHDVSGAEESDTILDIEGSPVARGEIWVGTDDGVVQLTRDGGKHWKNVTPPGAPQYGRFASIAPSPLSDGTAYAINDAHYLGDNAPHVYVTHDFGAHWRSITDGLPAGEWSRAVGADIHNRNIAYLGTEEGLWISFNGGLHWEKFRNNLPPVSVHDIRMQRQFDDLVIATHGRAVYVMDDMTPVQNLPSAERQNAFLFQPRVSYQYNQREDDEGTYTNYAADNPPTGTMIYYYLKQPAKKAPVLEILDSKGHVIRTYQGTHKVFGVEKPYVPNEAGINRFVWSWTIAGPVKWNGAAKERYKGPDDGPQVPPGSYSARLTVDGREMSQRFVVKADPSTLYTQQQFEETFQLVRLGFRLYSNVDVMLNNLDTVKKAIDDAGAAAKKANDSAATAKLAALTDQWQSVRSFLTADYHNDEDSIQRPGALREDLQSVGYLGLTYITPGIRDSLTRTQREYATGAGKYNAFVQTQLPALNGIMTSLKLKPITIGLMESR